MVSWQYKDKAAFPVFAKRLKLPWAHWQVWRVANFVMSSIFTNYKATNWTRGNNYKKIEQNQLTWYGHVQRMAEGRLPKIALKWMPKQKRARGRPKKNWIEGIRKAMNERNLNEGQWEDRKQWSLGVRQHRKTFWPWAGLSLEYRTWR